MQNVVVELSSKNLVSLPALGVSRMFELGADCVQALRRLLAKSVVEVP